MMGIAQAVADFCTHREDAAAAVADASGGRLTYRELADRAGAVAAAVRAKGLGAESVVALSMETTVDLVAAIVGVSAAGAAYLPLNPRDPAVRRRQLVADAGAAMVISDADLAGLPPAALEVADETPAALAYVRYTSGSTGGPKGVAISAGNLAAYTEQILQVLAPTAGDVFSLVQPVSFDSCLTMLQPALVSGGTLWVVPPEQAADAAWMAAHLRDVDYLKITPSHLRALQDAGDPAALLPARAVVLGGEPSDWTWFAGLGKLRPGCAVVNHYGPTETAVGVAALTGGIAEPADTTPLGPAMGNATLYVLDENLRPAAEGELFVGGATVGRGYVGRPGATAAAFLPDPYVAGARMYRTGDRVRTRGDGTYEFLGRLDDQLKIRGHRVEPAEVAAVLASHPDVRRAVVMPADDNLVGYVIGGDAEAVRAYAAERLPDYLVPALIQVVDSFPLTVNGKLDLRQLDVRTTATEREVAAVFAELLGRPVTDPAASFFALGGHSLLAARLLSRLRARFQVEIAVRAVFEDPTVGGLAALADAARQTGGGQLPPVRPVPRSGRLLASYGQERLWFLNQLDPESPLYNTNFGVRALGELDLEVLRACVTRLVRRHEALRTRLVPGADGLVQEIEEVPDIAWEFVDLSALSEEEAQKAAQLLIADYTERPFDLTAEIPLRTVVARLAEDEHILLLSMHHVATEGPSMRILHRELGELYPALLAGRPDPLPPVAAQYVDFAAWQRDLLARGGYQRQLEFWRDRLAGLPPRLELRTDLPRPAEVSPAGDRVRFDLPAELTGRLHALATEEGGTLFMVLLAGFHLVLAERTAQRDMAIGVPVAFRPRPELEQTVGYFGNTLVLRTVVDRDRSFRDLLRDIRVTTLDAIAHRDLPFEALVEEFRPRRRFGDNPLVNVMLVMAGEQRPPVALEDVTFQPEPIDTGTAKAEIVALFEAVGDGLAGEIEFRTDLFTTAGVRPMAIRFVELFTAVLDRPDAPVSDFLEESLPTVQPVLDEVAEVATEYVAPRTDLERELCEQWISLIGNDDIGVTDRFFDVGGHSLLAARVIAWIDREYGVTVPVRWCFDHPTVADLSLLVLAAQLDGLDDDLLAQLDGGT